jgi:hypothetical protein
VTLGLDFRYSNKTANFICFNLRELINMKKYTTSILCMLSLFGINSAFAQNFEWVRSVGSNATDQTSWSITTDASGNVYTTGQGKGVIDFDPGSGVSSFNLDTEGDIFIQKMDANGNFLWARCFGSAGIPEIGYSITTDPSGNVYTIGIFGGTVDFDPGLGTSNLTAVGGGDIFILKLDSNGNFLWAKSFGSDDYEFGYELALDPSGNIYTAGKFSGTADFDPDVSATFYRSSEGFEDAYIQKLDPDGNLLWAKTFGGQIYAGVSSLKVDGLSNCYVTGTFFGTVDFDPGTEVNHVTSWGDYDIFIQKMDSSGNFLWVKTFGGISNDQSTSLGLDSQANVYTTGLFSGTADFDPGIATDNHTSAGAWDAYVQKLDSSGNFLWAKTFGGTSNEMLMNLALDLSGNVYTQGTFYGSGDFDPDSGSSILTSMGDDDVYLHKLDTDGHFVWAKSIGGTSQEWSRSIALDATGNIYTTGFFQGTADFYPNAGISNHTAIGSQDIYIQKLSQTTAGIHPLTDPIEWQVYPNPSRGEVTVSFKKEQPEAELTLTDLQGKVIQTQLVDQLKNTTIELPASSGIYFLHVRTPKGQQTLKLIKE